MVNTPHLPSKLFACMSLTPTLYLQVFVDSTIYTPLHLSQWYDPLGVLLRCVVPPSGRAWMNWIRATCFGGCKQFLAQVAARMIAS